MAPKIKVTNQELFNEKDVDVDVEGLQRYNNSFHGTVSIECNEYGWRDITGEHGPHDYEIDYGFIIVNE